MNLVSRIIGHGTYESGVNKGKPFIRVMVNGKGQTLPVTENVAKQVEAGTGYVFLSKIALGDKYPTTNDSTTMDEKGNPIYLKGADITVAQYWAKRNKALEATCLIAKTPFTAIEPRALYNFSGIPTPEECRLLAGETVKQMQFA